MAKEILKKKFECFNSSRTKQNSNVVLANQVTTTDKGPAARQAINIVDPDVKLAGLFEPGKKYTVTITED